MVRLVPERVMTPVLSTFALSWKWISQNHTILSHTVPCHTVLSHAVPSHTVLSYAELSDTCPAHTEREISPILEGGHTATGLPGAQTSQPGSLNTVMNSAVLYCTELYHDLLTTASPPSHLRVLTRSSNTSARKLESPYDDRARLPALPPASEGSPRPAGTLPCPLAL